MVALGQMKCHVDGTSCPPTPGLDMIVSSGFHQPSRISSDFASNLTFPNFAGEKHWLLIRMVNAPVAFFVSIPIKTSARLAHLRLSYWPHPCQPPAPDSYRNIVLKRRRPFFRYILRLVFGPVLSIILFYPLLSCKCRSCPFRLCELSFKHPARVALLRRSSSLLPVATVNLLWYR